MIAQNHTTVQYGCIVVDMDGGEQRILDAVLAVVASRGLPAVSVRSVAATAGVSAAQVQYYFRTKERLLVASFEHVYDRMRQRIGAVDTDGTAGEVLRRYLLIWFPLDDDRRAAATVWLEFTAAASTTAQFEPIVRAADTAVLTALATLIVDGQANGIFRSGLDPVTTASLLLAIVDGLSVRALTHPDPRQLLPAFDQLLAFLFNTSSRQ